MESNSEQSMSDSDGVACKPPRGRRAVAILMISFLALLILGVVTTGELNDDERQAAKSQTMNLEAQAEKLNSGIVPAAGDGGLNGH